jgi:hypothetical protein
MSNPKKRLEAEALARCQAADILWSNSRPKRRISARSGFWVDISIFKSLMVIPASDECVKMRDINLMVNYSDI